MKSLLFVATAVASMIVSAEQADVAATSGYYDVTLTTKRLAHAEKVVSKTFTTSKSKGTAVDQYWEHMATVTNLAGFTIISGGIAADVSEVKKISVKYSYYAFKTDRSGNVAYTTKVVSESNKGVYDAKDGKVYLWNTSSKINVAEGDTGSLVEGDKLAKGYVAYEVPLAMHQQFISTDDNKAAGGFFGGANKAADGTVLDFTGFTAFGTGTMKNDELQSVAGNVAMKDPTDIKYGAFGTWKIQKDSSAKTKKASDIKTVLRNKGCVEMFEEVGLDK